MDKSWINKQRNSKAYLDGVASFIRFATEKSSNRGKIVCPCRKCCNCSSHTPEVVEEHLVWKGFSLGYTDWVFHGESFISSSSEAAQHAPSITDYSNVQQEIMGQENMRELIQDAFGFSNIILNNDSIVEEDNIENSSETSTQPHLPNVDATSYANLMQDCDEELYPGCTNFSKFSFILQLFHLKCLNGWSGKSFTMLLQLLKDAFPKGVSLPSSSYEAKKLIKQLGLGYEKIHACPNDCMLYWNESVNEENCRTCGASRWIINKDDEDDSLQEYENTTKKKKPAKVLRYFPLIPRLKRIFMSSKMASSMRWHEEGRTKDGILRHPADALAWKSFDSHHPNFASDPRSIRLGLASDGFNPFRTMSSTYSTWPVVLIPYNLPSWLCMKQSSLILSMVIPGEKGPGNDIDVFLQPLIHELNKLWEGVDAFDAFTKQNFNMRGALLWSINDFPAYANLSGWSTKGCFACPCCGMSTDSRWLKHGGKFCYMGHRRWLEQNHPFRFQKDEFDGSIELRTAPNLPSGIDIIEQLEGINNKYGKVSKSSRKRGRGEVVEEQVKIFEDADDFIIDSHNDDDDETRPQEHSWKKKSIFFDLPYWKDHVLRHNLDVMHIQKNVSDNFIGTMLNVYGRSKDNLKSRLDLKDMDIRHDLHPVVMPNNKTHIPLAFYTMSVQEKVNFLTVLKNLKVPDGYASNISRGVNLKERTLSNLKSHDGHILMQDIMPIAVRAIMPRQVVAVICELSSFFKSLCSKALNMEELDQLQSRIALTLCHMEKIFPPGFFTIMIHLLIHLIEEAKLGGPVHYRWMYPIERYLVRLKSYVRNRAQSEGSIAEGYIAEECLTFCSRYLEGVESIFNRPQRNSDNVDNTDNYMFLSGGRVLGKVESVILDDISLAQAHRYVLLHYDKIFPYRSEFLDSQRKANPNIRDNSNIEHKWLVEKFSEWLLAQVPQMAERKCPDEIIAIARGPNNVAKRCNGFIINGFRFHTKNCEKFRKTQNSGVMVEAEGQTYYAKLTDIFEIDYYGSFKVVLFRCDWIDIKSPRGLKTDTNDFILVNFSNLIHTGQLLKDDPFIFSSQAKQVFYVQDPKNEEWSHVITVKPRDLYDMGARLENDDDDETYTQCMPSNIPTTDELDNYTSWARSIVDETLIHDIGVFANSYR